jgi:hypothetical protein
MIATLEIDSDSDERLAEAQPRRCARSVAKGTPMID